MEGGTCCFRRGTPSWEPGQEMCRRCPAEEKTSRVIQRALDDARESRASPMVSRNGFGKGTLAMAARGSCPRAGAAGARAGWAGGAFGAAPRAACVRREGFVLQLSLCHLPEALPPPSASPSLPDVRSAGARKFPVPGQGAAASPKAPRTDPKRVLTGALQHLVMLQSRLLAHRDL